MPFSTVFQLYCCSQCTYQCIPGVNSLPNDKFLDMSKLKGFADDKLNVAEKMKFVEKGENAGNQHILLFPQCFQKASILWSLKVRIVW